VAIILAAFSVIINSLGISVNLASFEAIFFGFPISSTRHTQSTSIVDIGAGRFGKSTTISVIITVLSTYLESPIPKPIEPKLFFPPVPFAFPHSSELAAARKAISI